MVSSGVGSALALTSERKRGGKCGYFLPNDSVSALAVRGRLLKGRTSPAGSLKVRELIQCRTGPQVDDLSNFFRRKEEGKEGGLDFSPY